MKCTNCKRDIVENDIPVICEDGLFCLDCFKNWKYRNHNRGIKSVKRRIENRKK